MFVFEAEKASFEKSQGYYWHTYKDNLQNYGEKRGRINILRAIKSLIMLINIH